MPDQGLGILWFLCQDFFTILHASIQARRIAHHAGEKIVSDDHVKAVVLKLFLSLAGGRGSGGPANARPAYKSQSEQQSYQPAEQPVSACSYRFHCATFLPSSVARVPARRYLFKDELRKPSARIKSPCFIHFPESIV